MSHGFHGVSNYGPLDCFSNNLFRLTKEASQCRFTGPSWRPMDSPRQDPARTVKIFQCHVVFMIQIDSPLSANTLTLIYRARILYELRIKKRSIKSHHIKALWLLPLLTEQNTMKHSILETLFVSQGACWFAKNTMQSDRTSGNTISYHRVTDISHLI